MARKVEFNKNKVLNIITDHFWEYGYSNTSMSALVEKTGVKKASLYGAFGNKESMFELSLKNYTQRIKVINQSGIKYIETFLLRLLQESKGKGLKKGCLVMNSVLELSTLKDTKSKLSNSLWEKIRISLMEQVKIAQTKNEIEKEVDPEVLSKWIITQAFTIREFSKITDDSQYFDQISKNINLYLDNIKTKEFLCH